MCHRVVLAILVAALLSSCATVPMAPADADAAAKEFQVPAGKSRIYLIRPSGFAPAVLFTLSVDGRKVGLLPVDAYLIADVDPGEHTFVAAGNENEASVTLNAESGKAYFLRIGPRPGWLFARAAIYEVPESEGRPIVLRTSMIKGFRPMGE